ncbi:hypothetical protein CXG81DRAFT_10753 [Caulochytrium protostelioides]|uniref:non-specific serine/threonine protein kinase n=1 Tax=Caulochytrium protostelioides TaxID=1555241 RepID=A0A4P9XAR7_9FUNG|nr:hypothetical protein CXG81DRAFT_10753 [Caulochytrium protostelioides]|eukprot:RKP02442.1 hypothetical protein CXG81DRAFT_10753 [Caulochytrium protostelioides]
MGDSASSDADGRGSRDRERGHAPRPHPGVVLSTSTLDRAQEAKLRLESFYTNAISEWSDREERRRTLERELDASVLSPEKRLYKLAALGKRESEFLRLRRVRMSASDFTSIKVIGRGAFGEVRLVQKVNTGKIYAMKIMRKRDMVERDQLAHVKAERDILAESARTPWVVQLYYSFQDPLRLYLVMEFVPGGDLMTMFIKYDTFSEDVTRFYMAELLSAIAVVHQLGYVHRDIKPDNILIDVHGHIKLSDFGLATGFHKTHDSGYYRRLFGDAHAAEASGRASTPASMAAGDGSLTAKPSSLESTLRRLDLTVSSKPQIETWKRNRRQIAYSTVGTPDYIAPEVFDTAGYTKACDYWSVGAIVYECLVGHPPFCSETAQETYLKIIHWPQCLSLPQEILLSPEAIDLLRRLLTHAPYRMGAAEARTHPFFRGVPWDELRQIRAPFVPQLKSITDTSYFSTEEIETPLGGGGGGGFGDMAGGNGFYPFATSGPAYGGRQDLAFLGYTYKRWETLRDSL